MAKSRICSIPDCGKKHYARGWCKSHYANWSRHGQPVTGREKARIGKFYANVVLKYEGDECLIWPFGTGKPKISRNGKMVSVCRQLCTDLYGPPPTDAHQAAHECGQGHRRCVTKSHLSWKSPSENQRDRIRHGTHLRGERNPAAKLTEEDILAIRSLAASQTVEDIATTFGITENHTHLILHRHIWKWL